MSNLKFYISTFIISLLPNFVIASEPKPWQIDLQPPSGIIAETATDLHNFLLIVITLISLFVLALLVYVCWRYKENTNKVPSKTSHNTIIEVLWTVIPVLILIVIAVPSFKLLYLQETDKKI
jgi:cytochrome c oxidase subunit 2